MINSILLGIISLITNLVTLLLTPIDNLISSFLPDLSTALSSVSAFLTLCFSGIGWVISLFGLSSDVISILILYYTFKLTAPLMFYLIKLAISWYNRLKP